MSFAEHCNALAAACGEGGVWVKEHDEIVRNEQESLQKELRKAARTFRRCARAADRKMCAGVFGPSQAGKSYLISALARDAQGRLNARFGAESLDFISEINPGGGKESTGLVTRFTMTAPAGIPADYPMCIRLLTETDLVKIIANTYYADCEHKEEVQSDIPATLALLSKQANEPENSRIDLDALEDLREYLDTEFRAKARVQELERSYWEQALVIGPRLSLDNRIKLYALIWDEVDQFTNLLTTLLNALEQLGHAEEAYCKPGKPVPGDPEEALEVGALIPRKDSIIDVANLEGLDGSGGRGGSLNLVTSKGQEATLPRAVVTALTAELVIVMREKPAPYFDHTDLLDFPGYRSRYKFDDVRKELDKEGMLKEMFLRGKVAYLFQRYCADLELASMLLCIGPSNQEVQDLPGVINNWVEITHGKNPADRTDKRTSLLFVLTKADMEFEDKAGGTPKTRWDTRLHASLLDFFGKQHDWPTVWNGRNEPFDNLFLLRNPNVKWPIMNHREDVATGKELETGIRDEYLKTVGALKEAFMDSDLVKAHFGDPSRAWKALMTLNDGGITYIRESLSPLCDPDIKARQLRQRVESTRAAVCKRLENFYHSDDKAKLREQKLDMYLAIQGNLNELEMNTHRMGRLVKTLTISSAYIYNLHPEAYRRFLALKEEMEERRNNPQATAAAPVNRNNPSSWFAGSRQPSGARPEPVRDEYAFFADYIESTWVGNLHTKANDAALQKHFMLTERQFTALVSELATGAYRMGLHEVMAVEFRRIAAFPTNPDNIIRQQACFAAHVINNFVSWLGFNPLQTDATQRTVQWTDTGETRVLFTLPPEIKQGKFPDIQEKRRTYTYTWFIDWMMGFHALVMDNVTFDGGEKFDVKANDALGAILRKLGREEEARAAAQAS